MSLLEVDKINSYYGDSHIVFDVSMRLEEKEVVALLGRNGAGKSTTLKSLMGSVDTKAGSIKLGGRELRGVRRHTVANAGMQLVPEERRIFGSLNVEENIILAGLTAKPAWPLERIYAMFPRLKERRTSRGTDLSGGEQQMLAIARILRTGARFLMLDEPTEGLAPVIIQQIGRTIAELKRQGFTILLVEQNVAAALSISSRAYILNNGHVVFDGTSADLKASPEILSRYVGV
jgi:branched-chain amino acid transport system ATP-binding protein